MKKGFTRTFFLKSCAPLSYGDVGSGRSVQKSIAGSEKKMRGFTLIELLVVIAIIGLLSSVVFASLGPARVKSRDAVRLSDLRQLKTALELYYESNNNTYPNSGGNWDGIYTCWGDSSGESNPNGWITGLAPTYISRLPRDPRNHTDCGTQYIYLSDGANYKLIAHNVENNAAVIAQHPQLADPARPTYSYGYWTPGASSW